MVRRLVEDEEVRARGDDEREREPPPLAARERGDRLLAARPSRRRGSGRAGSAPAGRRRPVAPCAQSSTRAALVQLDLVLREVRGLDAVAESHLAAVGLAAAEQRLEQRRLARAVRADERDVLAALEREASRRAAALARRRRRRGPRPRPRCGRCARGLRNSKPSRRAVRVSSAISPCAFACSFSRRADLRQLGLRLLGLRLLVRGTARRSARAARCRGRRGRRPSSPRAAARRLLAAPVVPRAGEVRRAAGLQLEHGGRRRLEEPAVVRDEDDGGVDRLQRRARATRGCSTSRWLVGSSRSSRSGSPPSARASEARVSSPPENVSSGRSRSSSAKPRPRSDRVDALAPGVAAGVLEPRLRLGVAAERRGLVVAAGHRLLEPRELLLGRDQVAGAGERVLAQRQSPLERRPLVVQRDARPLLERELAAVQLGLARPASGAASSCRRRSARTARAGRAARP